MRRRSKGRMMDVGMRIGCGKGRGRVDEKKKEEMRRTRKR